MDRPSNDISTRAAGTAIAEIAALLGDRISTGAALREQHANTVSWAPRQPPDAVAFPRDTGEVAAILRICAAHDVPVIGFGAGSSLEGHVNAPWGGVCVDFSQMKRVVAVNAGDLDCVVEAGITRKELNEHLRDTGLFFPVDPGADASIGGMASTRASGTNAVRYGTMRENVLALTVVLPDGEVVRTARRARKSASGYDLTRLFVGAEGTLGLITEVTLKLHGIPEAVSAGVCAFPSVHAACDAAILAIQSGIPVARIELMDEVQVKACNAYSRLHLPETPLLFVEFHGSHAGVKEQATSFDAIAREMGGGPLEWAVEAQERSRLWQARHDAFWAGKSLRPGWDAFSTDVCVPISRLADCVAQTKADIGEHGLIAPIVGHVGDGNFHVLPLVDMADEAAVAAARAFSERLVHRALAMDGTCSGEHGIGQMKMKYLAEEHGEAALGVMRALKAALDPKGIMNPGKLVPPPATV